MTNSEKWLTVLNWSLTIAIVTYSVLIIDTVLSFSATRAYKEIQQTLIIQILLWIDMCTAFGSSILAGVISIALRQNVVPERKKRRFLWKRIAAISLFIITIIIFLLPGLLVMLVLLED